MAETIAIAFAAFVLTCNVVRWCLHLLRKKKRACVESQYANVCIEFKKFKEISTDDGVFPIIEYKLEVTGSKGGLVTWITVEYAFLFKDAECQVEYSQNSVIGDLGTSSAVRTNTIIGGRHYSEHIKQCIGVGQVVTIPKTLTYSEKASIEELKKTFQGVAIYKFYGEFLEGNKFEHLARPDLTLNDGRLQKTISA